MACVVHNIVTSSPFCLGKEESGFFFVSKAMPLLNNLPFTRKEIVCTFMDSDATTIADGHEGAVGKVEPGGRLFFACDVFDSNPRLPTGAGFVFDFFSSLP